MGMRIIPQRELRNDIARVLREVEAGEHLRITIDGRPVADLVPIGGVRRTFVSREDLTQLRETASLDAGFQADVAALTGATIDDR
jgi:prevent-host-death family protein